MSFNINLLFYTYLFFSKKLKRTGLLLLMFWARRWRIIIALWFFRKLLPMQKSPWKTDDDTGLLNWQTEYPYARAHRTTVNFWPLSSVRRAQDDDDGRGRGLCAQLHAEAPAATGGRRQPVDIWVPSAVMSQTGNHVVPGRNPAGRGPQDRHEDPGRGNQHLRGCPRAGWRGRVGRRSLQS